MLSDDRETERLAALEATGLIEETKGINRDLDAIALVAAHLFDVPIALVTLIDSSVVWVRGSHGVDSHRTARRDAFCNETIRLAPGETFVVLDTLSDPRFANTPLVVAEPHARFYAGVPITTEADQVIGTLCIMDRVPRKDFGPRLVQELQKLAIVVEAQLARYQSHAARDAEARERIRVEALLRRREREYQDISKIQEIAETVGGFGLWHVDLEAWTIVWSAGIACIFDRPMPDTNAVDIDVYLSFYHPDDQPIIRRRFLDAKAGKIGKNNRYHGEARLVRPNGEVRFAVVEGIAKRDRSNRVVSLHGVLLDTTDLTRSEQQARATSHLLRTTLENMDQGLMMLGPDQRVRIHNQRARDLLGLSEDLLFDGAPFAAIRQHQIASGEFENAPKAFRDVVLRGGLEQELLIHERARPDGTVLEVRSVPLADGGVVRTYTDITRRREIERAAQKSAERFRLLAETTTDVIIWSDLDTIRRYVSPAAKAVLGYDADELVGTKPIAFTHPDDAEELSRRLNALTQGRVDHTRTHQRFRRKDGTWIWVEGSLSSTRDAAGLVSGYVGSVRDISERKAAEDALRLSQDQLALALDSGSDGLFDLNVVTGQVSLSGPWLAILGYGENDFMPSVTAWGSLIHSDDITRCRLDLSEHLAGKTEKFECEYRVRRRSSDYIWILTRGKVVSRDPQGRPLRMVGTHIDITRRKEAEQLVVHMAHHDALTGLPNRVLFQERLHQQLVSARDQCFGVLACDLDGFKAVNDALGHSAGDRLLRIVAERLRSASRNDDTVARLGGDEFAVILGNIDGEKTAKSAAQRMIHAIQQPFQIDGRSISIGMSIGLAVAPSHGLTAEHLLKNADIALYKAKAEGRNTFQTFKTGMDALIAERNEVANNLRGAVQRDEFKLVYQPIVNIDSGRISGFEALLRWHDPKRGEIEPDAFIPIAEETGLIVALGAWALKEACQTATSWPSHIRIAVNVSTVQFDRPDELQQSVAQALSSSGLAADRLELEITESVLMHDAEVVIACLHALRKLGVRIALDDFGTGFSSLNYLRRFPFSKIKIDQSFVRDISDPDTVAIVRAVVGLAARVKADITAEGVETRDQLMRVRQEGCTEAQGYFFSRPLTATFAADLVKKKRPRVAA